MAQLIHFVIADDHGREPAADILQAFLTACQSRNTGARKGDLAGGGEHKHPVLIAKGLAFLQQDRRFNDLAGEMMHNVCLVPENLEVRRGGFHGGETANGLVAVHKSVRVGILRHTPDSLDGVILRHQTLDHIHVGAGLGHGNIDHLKAQFLGDAEMPVVAGNGTKELPVFHLTPGFRRVLKSEHIANGHQIIHQLQAGVAAHKNLLRPGAHHFREQGAGLIQTFQIAVVAGVRAVRRGVILHFQKFHRQVHLMRAGFAAGHIEL